MIFLEYLMSRSLFGGDLSIYQKMYSIIYEICLSTKQKID
jgi:hypothetical protein